MAKKYIGIDIGGTKIHLGIVSGSQLLKEIQFPTPAHLPEKEIIDQLCKEIDTIFAEDIAGFGIGVPGLVDENSGIIYDLWNIPSWKEVALKDFLEKKYDRPVKITNDANTFALGEKYYGKGQNYKNLVTVSLGTGFGTGIIANHQLYSGTLSGAGELGDIPYLDKTIEDYCSGKFFSTVYSEDGKSLFQKAEAGDEKALKIFEDFGNHVGNAFKVILYTLAPEAIFIGGSISRSFPYFEKSMWEAVHTFPFKKIIENLIIEVSEIDNIALLGAVSLFENSKIKEY
ncbi:ROK family protein [Gramella sp. AN32]|uniref:ROK family protein n=1 Tax=Christiangramia antarctica TaxID=2058158 RepID=A0ABW5X366_9FLAO|nr:ROK family protein [Gramella sp. AN32]MCM4156297.1 sugar kinase [Gramella sp. AN32]